MDGLDDAITIFVWYDTRKRIIVLGSLEVCYAKIIESEIKTGIPYENSVGENG